MSHYAFGDSSASLHVYVEKSPPCEELWGEAPESGHVKALQEGDIKSLGNIGGNGWRKVFNVYAKLLFTFPESSPFKPSSFSSWQDFRDQALLQSQSGTSLLFGDWDVEENARQGGIHIIAGRTHALKLGLSEQCVWLDNEFAKHTTLPIFICPYFDYRQLSNVKIERLVGLIEGSQR
ncbi:hypothetical protein [Grimontia sp. SpTr1]|uniref:DUF6942 family protein n=1 Tax=Grimontia sp. SpTr1 TaxID=2995319 RepID=UPI00248C7401|nr:hypothetical protein [Grimontia sp. SpTr1]